MLLTQGFNTSVFLLCNFVQLLLQTFCNMPYVIQVLAVRQVVSYPASNVMVVVCNDGVSL